MGKLSQNLSVLVLVAAAQAFSVAAYGVDVFAEPRRPSAIIPAGTTTAKLDSQMMTSILAPNPLQTDDQFYRTYVAALDDRIEREYQQRWSFHELNANYGTRQSQNQKHINPGTLEFHDAAIAEKDYRRAFAQQILQLRLQRGVEQQLKNWKSMKSVERTMRALQEASVQSISLAKPSPSGATGPATRPNPLLGDIRIGYDIMRDFSKVEYSCPALDLGVYRAFLLGTGGSDRSFYSQLLVKTDASLPSPAVRYHFNVSMVDFSLSKVITKTLSGSIATSQGVGRATGQSYGMSVAYSF